jgi:hypothetical protein
VCKTPGPHPLNRPQNSLTVLRAESPPYPGVTSCRSSFPRFPMFINIGQLIAVRGPASVVPPLRRGDSVRLGWNRDDAQVLTEE